MVYIYSVSGEDMLQRLVNPVWEHKEADIIHYMKQICDGITHLHKCNIIHLDLKVSSYLIHSSTTHFGITRSIHFL